MINLTPFLLFDGDCAEAMTFYQTCLGGELTLMKVSDTSMKDQVPPEHAQKIINAHLISGDIEFTATDWMHPTRAPRQGNMVCMYINGGRYSELRAIFDKLSAGADQALLDDLRDLPFGSYGHLADKYGVHWFFQGEKKHGV
ncbi:VOC family protein [Geothrix oryzisoli]|uniref:VOC family protein n=1 Tax=Geothrix oryzisoli TaxID=2922721 RepID=UPI001FADDDE3|nr:VOC family protein [Geothrix oryzisoli]